jgi:hypothetical protein
MPDKPTWCGLLADITRHLRELPDPWVDRQTIQSLLGIGTRRAQQILAPCVQRQIGANGVADREVLLAHLNRLATGEASHYEHQRRRRLAEQIAALRRERSTAVLVEAPTAVVNQQIEHLPAGVSITPGRITVSFGSTREALEKLLALAMAVGNDPLLFERMATGAK